jgi:hypothetical protein
MRYPAKILTRSSTPAKRSVVRPATLGPATLCALALAFASAASLAEARDFPEVVSEVLKGQTDGPMTSMRPEQKTRMIVCVNEVLEGVPKSKKRYVVAGTDFEEREHRFGEVVQANRAEWKKKIARACADIAIDND